MAHNTLLNFLGLAVPLGVAFFVMPIAAVHLGPARFGLLGIAWALTEYLVLFDLGLGRAAVKFVADALERGREHLSEIASLSTVTQLLAGLVGGALFALAAPWIVDRAFDLRGELAAEATSMLRVVGLNLPAVLLLSALRGILEGAERFDLSNGIKMLSSAASATLPAIGAVLGASLPTILWWVLLSRLAGCAVYLVAIRVALPSLRWTIPRRWTKLRELFAFSGWVLLSNALNPVLIYFDRFALGTIVGVAAVGIYLAPYEGVTRLLLIPVSIMGTLFPAFATLQIRQDHERLVELHSASVRTLLVLIAPPLALILAFAPQLLLLWLGEIYAEQASTALRILAVGVFFNAIAHPPYIALYALNRPDIPAKFHLVELVFHIPLTILLIRNYGIVGAATAWTVRVTFDLVLLLGAISRRTGMSIADAAGGHIIRSGLAIVGLVSLLLLAARVVTSHASGGLVLAAGAIAMFSRLSWSAILREGERGAIRSVFRIPGRGTLTGSGAKRSG